LARKLAKVAGVHHDGTRALHETPSGRPKGESRARSAQAIQRTPPGHRNSQSPSMQREGCSTSATWPPHIVIHTLAALTALLLGIVQLAAPKGTLNHRAIGWLWIWAMLIVAVTSLMIRDTGLYNLGGYTVIHLFTALTLVTLPLVVAYARAGNVRGHRIAALSLFFGALVVAGLFTLLPHRRLGQLLWSAPGLAG
jgi:uncharacterized membrane protein